jgi:biotin-dependent carboxylase-like uncharacterized protein
VNALEVLEAGPATTVQDLGRPGYGVYGVPAGGAMDRGLVVTANRIAGNRSQAPALEFALKGPRMRWLGETGLPCVVAGDSISEVTLAPGEELAVASLRRRAYGYIAVVGGFEVPVVMGGRGTCLPGEFGGFEGRELRPGDRLAVSRVAGARKPRPRVSIGSGEADPIGRTARVASIRILPGDRRVGGSAAFHALLEGDWRAGAGNRVGLRLEGPVIWAAPMRLSQPIPPGAIQVTGAGQPIVLLRDHPTVGGYPVVAVVAAADLDTCVQLRLDDPLRFVRA